MTRRTRATLKNFFTPGARPTRDQFGDLIDSSLIMDDEGFSKTPADGLKIATIGDELGLISFQRQKLVTQVDWSWAFGDGDGRILALKPSGAKDAETPPIISFQAKSPKAAGASDVVQIRANVGIGAPSPGYALDVSGVVCADGRVGREFTPVDADGDYHPITPVLKGCVAFEVMAVVKGVKGEGRYGLLHAIAMNVSNPSRWDNILGLKKRIHSQHAYYARRSDRLQLSWRKHDDDAKERRDPNSVHGMNAQYTLNIRSRSTYNENNEGIKIRAFVTQLWGDPWFQDPVGSKPAS